MNGDRFEIPPIWLKLHCQTCGDMRNFDPKAALDVGEVWNWKFLTYTCRDCGRYSKFFAVLIRRSSDQSVDAEVMKLGEYPPFSAPVSRKVETLLEKADLEMYRKGTRSEAQGLGVGAATYFRRIVESQWKLLVQEIRDAAKQLGGDVAIYEKALQETQFAKAVEMLKDALPAKLLILDKQNPLTLLYRPLSQGLHELTDEQCLQQAADIRIVLTALLENISDVLKDQQQLKDAATRLSQSKA